LDHLLSKDTLENSPTPGQTGFVVYFISHRSRRIVRRHRPDPSFDGPVRPRRLPARVILGNIRSAGLRLVRPSWYLDLSFEGSRLSSRFRLGLGSFRRRPLIAGWGGSFGDAASPPDQRSGNLRGVGPGGVLFINPVLVSHNTQARPSRTFDPPGSRTRRHKQAWHHCGDRFHHEREPSRWMRLS